MKFSNGFNRRTFDAGSWRVRVEMNCLLFSTDEIAANGTIRVTGNKANHIRSVLKKEIGDSLVAGILDGPLGVSRIVEISDGEVVVTRPEGPTPPPPPVDIILAMPRPKVMKRLWAPLASMGVSNIFLIGASRVETNYFASHAVEPDVYLPRLIEGLEQARDNRLPIVTVTPNFVWFVEKLLPNLAAKNICLIGQPGAKAKIAETIGAAQRGPEANRAADRVVIAIGPEGGWTPGELETFAGNGFITVGCGHRSLRTDTAIIALLALIYDAMPSVTNSNRP